MRLLSESKLGTVGRSRSLRGGLIVALAGAVVVSTAGCRGRHEGTSSGDISRNWTPPAPSGIKGVPASDVSSAILKRLDGQAPAPLNADQWKHVKRLYKTFNGVPLWLDNAGLAQPRTKQLLSSLAAADSDAVQMNRLPLTAVGQALHLVRGNDRPTMQDLAEADVSLTAAYAALGEIMLTGQIQPNSVNQSWHINPLEEHVDSALVLTLKSDSLDQGLARMRPADPNYGALREQLIRYRAIVAHGGWTTVPPGKQLRVGDSDNPARLAALRQRLASEGLLTDSTTASTAPDTTSRRSSARAQRRGPNVYDAQLAGAVAEFQRRHSIGVDSMLGAETVNAMNVPAQYRLTQIAANLERYRWMPRQLGSRYIIVNVPEFRLEAYDSGQKALEMKVIVGQEYQDKATPVFSDSMEYLVFRPYWNVTPDIAAKEIWPKVAQDPDYLARNRMEVWNDNGQRGVRQLPGPKNSLGLVKFMFPNDFNIYLHDTPNGELFNKDVRAFSHGCIRLEKPDQLAQFVLGWPEDKVQQEMQNGPDNHTVKLPRKIPVYIVYFTTFMRDGQLNFGNDLYLRDGQLVDEVKDAAIPTPEAQRALAALDTIASQM